MSTPLLPFTLALSVMIASSGIAYADDDTISSSLVEQGYKISPIPRDQLNLTGKSTTAVGIGSYLVNAVGDCSGCHSFPQFLEKGSPGGNSSAGDPFEGISSTPSISGQLVANFNVSHYLGGGQCFGPFMARNLTPDQYGPVEGLTEDEFITVMRTGEDVHCDKFASDPICALGPPTPLLQVMPWPTYHSMTDAHLRAIYAYLSAVPAATACNTVANGCPGYSGDAAPSANYAYPNTSNCPNPAPPQYAVGPCRFAAEPGGSAKEGDEEPQRYWIAGGKIGSSPNGRLMIDSASVAANRRFRR